MTHYKLATMAAHRHDSQDIAHERLVIQIPRFAAVIVAHEVTRPGSGPYVELVLDCEREDLSEPAIGAAQAGGSDNG